MLNIFEEGNFTSSEINLRLYDLIRYIIQFNYLVMVESGDLIAYVNELSRC